MKRILFSLVIVSVFYFNAGAQMSQGSIAVGGEFTIQSSKQDFENNNSTTHGPKTFDFTLLPSAEYFITDNISAGLKIGYTLSRSKQENVNGALEVTNKTGMFVVNPFARMYFKLGDRFSLFGEAGVGISTGKNTSESKYANTTVTTEYKRSEFSFGVSPGAMFMISDKVALETTFGFLGYSAYSYENGADSSVKTGTFGLRLDPSSISFGLKFFIK